MLNVIFFSYIFYATFKRSFYGSLLDAVCMVLSGALVIAMCVIQLQRDEQQEREKRFQALESAMEKQRQEHGALLPAKKVQALYEALEQKDAQIYCKRAKV